MRQTYDMENMQKKCWNYIYMGATKLSHKMISKSQGDAL
jgi:hypothetical protein